MTSITTPHKRSPSVLASESTFKQWTFPRRGPLGHSPTPSRGGVSVAGTPSPASRTHARSLSASVLSAAAGSVGERGKKDARQRGFEFIYLVVFACTLFVFFSALTGQGIDSSSTSLELDQHGIERIVARERPPKPSLGKFANWKQQVNPRDRDRKSVV